MTENLRKVYRKNGYAGEFSTDTGSVNFSEDHGGDGFYFEIFNSLVCESQRIYLSTSDIHALAQIGVITECFTTEQLREEIPEIVTKKVDRDRHLREMAEKRTEMWRPPQPQMPDSLDAAYDEAHRPLSDIYGDPLGGGDGSIGEYYAVEGWGIQKLDSGDFEVTYKV